MPGFDGTGPRGLGPMSGKGGGYCLMSIPDDPTEAKIGFAGQAGIPMNTRSNFLVPGISALHVRLQEIRVELHEMKSRLADLEARNGRP
jgi:hypothetical protein